MTDERPDPDRLLARIQEDESRALRGKLKIFFGASAGVGKTFAMLNAARRLRDQGVDVVIGVVETHGRAETEALVAGFERLPLRSVLYRDRELREFDLDAVLQRRPKLILVDELAHSNVVGSRHPKRWQDVEELLASGIDVYSTINVQHLETLNDVVSGITGIRVWETVPDRVFDEADEVVLVDLTPDELLQRLREGKVYLANQAERAIRNFFRKGNLIALRELALRRTADRVDVEMMQYRRDKSVSPVWQTRDSLLACIGPEAGAERVVRSAARIASRLEVPWHAIYVETPALQQLSEARRDRILKALKLAASNGAETASLNASDPAEAAVKYARDHNLSRVVVGHRPRPAWRPGPRSFAQRVADAAPDLDVTMVARAERDSVPTPADSGDILGGRFRAPPGAYLRGFAIVALAAIIAAPLQSVLALPNIVMIFLLAVVVVAVRHGRGPAVMAAFLSVVEFDFFYVPPRFSFAVSDAQYLLTFAVMLAVALVTGQLTAGLKFQAHIATRRETRVRALYEMARDLSGALLTDQIAEICDRFLETEFQARSEMLLADDSGRIATRHAGTDAPPVDTGIAQWVLDRGEPAGLGTDTLPGSPILYLPLKAPMRLRGVLAIEPRDASRLLVPEQVRLLDTVARLIAIALERVHYVDVAQSTTLQMESERLRNSLLAAISHDLRTPLSALIVLADSLAMTTPPPTRAQAEISAALRDQAHRLSLLVENLLDMARLQAGRIEMNREWQPLEEVVGSALKSIEPSLAGHVVAVRLPADLPLVEFDATLMERVIANLVENAVKYTPAGSHIEIGAAIQDGSRVALWVDDDGPGLPPGREEDIFKKFERGDKESSTPGVGLGLAICRAIVDAHGGTIRAENRAGGGARFILELPRGKPPEVEAESAAGASAPA
ncbi:MAG TPA: two-component system sensor histidine kinase KdpD [Burkholderiaceae bacterium]|nr:two-component system sensor histidine kinase KdpD [Burkholderiaceae bacterium]